MVKLSLTFKTPNGDITECAISHLPRKAYAKALDQIMVRFPNENWVGVDYARASYNAFQMAINNHGVVCCTPYTAVLIEE